MQSQRMYEQEARIVQEGARSYKRGIRLSTIFQNGQTQKEVFYVNPTDIPLKIPRFYEWLYLYSVCPADKRQYPNPIKEKDPQAHFKIIQKR